MTRYPPVPVTTDSPIPTSALALAVAGVAVTALLAVLYPFATFALSLAAFGLPHVLAELRYVDRRFGARVRGPFALSLGVLLVGLVGVRVAGLSRGVDPDVQALLECTVLVALVVATLPALLRRSAWHAMLGVAVIVPIAAGAARAPLATLVVLAILHNLTPVGFLAERLTGAARRRAMAACAGVFVAVPLAIVSGVPARLIAAAGSSNAVLPSITDGRALIGAFVPAGVDGDWTLDLFRAAAFLQCMHYAAVLHVLPRLDAGPTAVRPWLDWPAPGPFTVALVALGGLFFIAFAASFTDVRPVYGVFAAVHAWIEVPLLLLATVSAAPRLTRAAR